MIKNHKEYIKKCIVLLLFGCASSFINGMDSSNRLQLTSSNDSLGWAAHNGDVEKTTSLLQNGCKLEVAPDGSTPLHTAAYHNELAVLRLLLTHPYYLPTADQVKTITKQSGIEEVAKSLTTDHFNRLSVLLASKTMIVSVAMTPYEAAWEKSEQGHDTQCRMLLEPTELQKKLNAQVTANYLEALKRIMEKASL